VPGYGANVHLARALRVTAATFVSDEFLAERKTFVSTKAAAVMELAPVYVALARSLQPDGWLGKVTPHRPIVIRG